MAKDFNKFKIEKKVAVAERYLTDEVTEHFNTSPVATIISEPSDEEELVGIQYDSKEIDYVPQDILEVLEQNEINVLCPECFKGKIETKDNKEGVCNNCGTQFIIITPNTVKFK